MVNMTFLFGAIAIMLIIIVADILKKYFEIDMDEIKVEKGVKKWRRIARLILAKYSKKNDINKYVITRNTGTKSLKMLQAGENKATVLATLRQITGIDYNSAKNIVDSVPSTFMVNISEKEANLTKQALEFVGATVEIK